MINKRTKIIATIGPATNNYKTMRELALSGVNVFRINLSHSNQEAHQKVIDIVKKLRNNLKTPIGIMIDTRGPEIRVGEFKEGAQLLLKGNTFTFHSRKIMGDNQNASLSQPKILANLKVGGKILACNGLITFKIIEKHDDRVVCKVQNGGTISNFKSLFFPGIALNFSYLNDKDKKDIVWAINNNVNFIAASFVNSAEDVLCLKNFIKRNNGAMEIISKIESKMGIKNLDAIIDNSDAIMVARGDLGVEVPLEKLPKLQKNMIEKCHEKGKTVIIATEMLESMISSPRPTRAEASDVANAVFDGASAVMLSGETAIGDYPIEAVSTMARIVMQAEKNTDYKADFLKTTYQNSGISDIFSSAVVHISLQIKEIKAIAVYTDGGHTAKMISRFNPSKPIIAFTPNEVTFHNLSLVKGVAAILTDTINSADELLQIINSTVKTKKCARTNDYVLIGTATRQPTSTDMIKLHIVN